MKYFFKYWILLLLPFQFLACSDSLAKTPIELLRQYETAYKEKDLKKLGALFGGCMKKEFDEMQAKRKADKNTDMREIGSSPWFRPYEKQTIVKNISSEAGDKAWLRVSNIYNDDPKKSEIDYFFLKEDGQWKLGGEALANQENWPVTFANFDVYCKSPKVFRKCTTVLGSNESKCVNVTEDGSEIEQK